jgi:iduronate 2-sulfatase
MASNRSTSLTTIAALCFCASRLAIALPPHVPTAAMTRKFKSDDTDDEAPTAPSSDLKNVLFVPIDDQRPCYKSYGNGCISPAHDRLAAEGMIFTRAFANFAWCAPSRNSFMSGRRPDRTKAWDFEHHFRAPGVGESWTSLCVIIAQHSHRRALDLFVCSTPSACDLCDKSDLSSVADRPQRFKDAGYFTTGVGKLFHPGLPPQADPISWTDPKEYPITFAVVPHGPDKDPTHWHNHNGPQCLNTSSGRRYAGQEGRQCGLLNSGGPQGPELFDECDAQLTDLALQRLKVGAGLYHSEGRPFFVGLGFMNSHIPYHFPPQYGELYPPPEEFPIAKHPTMHASQPTVAWYDQGNTLPSPVGMAAHHDVIRSGGIAGSWGSGAGQLPPAPHPLPSTPLDPRTRPMNATLARIVRRNLYAAATYVDAQLGKMLDALDELQVTNSTLVVSFGDHGQNLGEHSLWEKMSVFETSVRVHLTIR